MAEKKPLYRTKTFWAGVGAVVTAAGGFLTGEMLAMEAAQLAFTGLIGIFLRAGVEKKA